jgi:MFS family permease
MCPATALPTGPGDASLAPLAPPAGSQLVETDVPARLDRLPWSGFHTLVVVALGITWILDGLEVTLAGAISGALKASPRLHMSDFAVGASASAYLAGAVGGALLFGWLTDRLGRKRLFSVTLGLYLLATAATALSPNVWCFAVFRFLTGAGIGGEYTAINSAIQEFIPARFRGHTDLVINGSFWLGAALGAGSAALLLHPGWLPPDLGWRLAFGGGAVLGLAILYLRRFLPESPRWQMTHGQIREAEATVAVIERRVGQPAQAPARRTRLSPRAVTLGDVARTLLVHYRRRAAIGLALMTAQAFFYNAIFFTYALVLTRFYGIDANRVASYLLPFAVGNFLGPLLLGRFFDTIGRRPMIGGTYIVSAILLTGTALVFLGGQASAATLTLAWTVVFFFASAAASSAYLTVSESFPLEVRALAIALFYAAGTALGGVAAPALFGALIGGGARSAVAHGYFFGAGLMALAGVIQWRWGFAHERRALEEIAAPLSASESS